MDRISPLHLEIDGSLGACFLELKEQSIAFPATLPEADPFLGFCSRNQNPRKERSAATPRTHGTVRFEFLLA